MEFKLKSPVRLVPLMKGYCNTGIHCAATGGSEGRHLQRCVASNRVVRNKLTKEILRNRKK